MINGAERVIVNQLVRSPGVSGQETKEKNGNSRYGTQVTTNRGEWIEFTKDARDSAWVKSQRTRRTEHTKRRRDVGA